MPSRSPSPSHHRPSRPDSHPTSRVRSRSPRGDSIPRHRSRSRSPPRLPKAKNFSGLKWKKTEKRDDDGGDGRRDDRRGRDYRDREDDRRRENDRYRGTRREEGGRERRDRFDRDDDRRRNDHGRRDGDRDSRRDGGPRKERDPDKPKEKKAAVAALPASGEQMIIVTVNDRLGTKAQIPCLASDPVKVFKAMVAARIGRPAHEIMLKRQGERPFKDQLTLEDYGVSNGVQIDLELDTGD